MNDVEIVCVARLWVDPSRNPRKTEAGEVATEALSESIKAHGLISPLCVIPHGKSPLGPAKTHRVIAGYRRFGIVCALQLEKIPVRIYPASLTADEELEIAGDENGCRSPITQWDRADLCRYLLERGFKPAAIGRMAAENGLPLQESRIYDYQRATSLPAEIQQKLRRHPSGFGVAMVLSKREFRLPGSLPNRIEWNLERQLEFLGNYLADVPDNAPERRSREGLRYRIRAAQALALAQSRGEPIVSFVRYLVGEGPRPE